jgi:hypothetical protein
MTSPKHYALPKQSATLKELSNVPMPDIKAYQEALRKKVQARRQLEDRLLTRTLNGDNGE